VKPKLNRLPLCFLLAACGGAYTYELKWPEGTTAAQYKKDGDACEIEARTGFADLANEMNAVGTRAADEDSQRHWNRCMESRGYALVKVPRRQAASAPNAH
jgi:hypothetical protein